jgi:hypothetical protein
LSEDFITPQHNRDPDRSGLSDASTTFEDSQLARLSQIIRREIANELRNSNALPAQLNADNIQRYINHQVLAAVAAQPIILDPIQRNRHTVQQFLGRTRDDPGYSLPAGVLSTQAELEQFRQAQLSLVGFSLVVWPDADWVFPPGVVEARSDSALAAAALADLVATCYPNAHPQLMPPPKSKFPRNETICLVPSLHLF